MTVVVTTRVAAFDRLRGLIIVLMALDHASFFIARVHPAETWASQPPYYADLVSFITRWITHLCAPGFFLLMGVGVAWLAQARLAAGWTPGRITRFLATRGAVLLVVQHVIENPAWLLGVLSMDPSAGGAIGDLPGPGGEVMLNFGVLSALGFALIVLSVAWRASELVGVGLMLAVAGLLSPMTPSPEQAAADPGLLMQLLFVPSVVGPVQVVYPWVPWLLPALGGLALGRLLLREPEKTAAVGGAGLSFLAIWLLARLAGGGSHEPEPTVIGWLTVTKYPPSEMFFVLMCGLNLMLLYAFMQWPVARLAPLETFGRAPFFFYLAHLYVLGALSWFFPTGTSFGVMYLVWLGVVLALYPACAWYARFKSSKSPDSLWRLL